MVRPQKNRRVAFNPEISYFKPRGIPMFDLEEVALTIDERAIARAEVGAEHPAVVRSKLDMATGNLRVSQK